MTLPSNPWRIFTVHDTGWRHCVHSWGPCHICAWERESNFIRRNICANSHIYPLCFHISSCVYGSFYVKIHVYIYTYMNIWRYCTEVYVDKRVSMYIRKLTYSCEVTHTQTHEQYEATWPSLSVTHSYTQPSAHRYTLHPTFTPPLPQGTPAHTPTLLPYTLYTLLKTP